MLDHRNRALAPVRMDAAAKAAYFAYRSRADGVAY